MRWRGSRWTCGLRGGGCGLGWFGGGVVVVVVVVLSCRSSLQMGGGAWLEGEEVGWGGMGPWSLKSCLVGSGGILWPYSSSLWRVCQLGLADLRPPALLMLQTTLSALASVSSWHQHPPQGAAPSFEVAEREKAYALPLELLEPCPPLEMPSPQASSLQVRQPHDGRPSFPLAQRSASCQPAVLVPCSIDHSQRRPISPAVSPASDSIWGAQASKRIGRIVSSVKKDSA